MSGVRASIQYKLAELLLLLDLLKLVLVQIAKDTHGFVGADLSQLCMEAALRCIREQMHTIDVDADKIPVVSEE